MAKKLGTHKKEHQLNLEFKIHFSVWVLVITRREGNTEVLILSEGGADR